MFARGKQKIDLVSNKLDTVLENLSRLNETIETRKCPVCAQKDTKIKKLQDRVFELERTNQLIRNAALCVLTGESLGSQSADFFITKSL